MSEPEATPEYVAMRKRNMASSCEIVTLIMNHGNDSEPSQELVDSMVESVKDIMAGGLDSIYDQARLTTMVIHMTAKIMKVDPQELWQELSMVINTAMSSSDDVF